MINIREELARLGLNSTRPAAVTADRPTGADLEQLKMRSTLRLLARDVDDLKEKVAQEPDMPGSGMGAGLTDIIAGGAAALDHPWNCDVTGATTATVTLGKVFLGGADKTITSWPTDGALTSITTSIKYWLQIDFSASTVTWCSGVSYATSTDSMEVWPLFEITCADDVITGVFLRQWSDIHITKAS